MAEKKLNPLHAMTGQNALCAKRRQKRLCSAQETRSGVTLNMEWLSYISKQHFSFNELACLPILLDIEKLDEGDGIAATFIKRNAKWHKTCKKRLIT